MGDQGGDTDGNGTTEVSDPIDRSSKTKDRGQSQGGETDTYVSVRE
jgi:hypothetical protein